MAQTNKLTDRKIRTTWQGLIPADSPVKLFDGGGLYLLLNPPKREPRRQGGAYWRLKYRISGVEKLLSLGVYPEVTLAKARDRRDAARDLIGDGRDPSIERKTERASQREATSNTFKGTATEWLAMHGRWAQSYRRTVVGRLDRHVYPEIGDEPIGAITGPRMLEVLKKIERHGIPETAHRVRADVDRIFRYGIRTFRAQVNPTPHPEVLQPRETKPFASIKKPAAIAGLIRSIRGYHGSPTVKHSLELAPLVFVRPGELRQAEWAEIDLERRLWTIAAERMKSRLRHLVPLSQQAVEILKAQRDVSGKGRFVFPSVRHRDQGMSNNTILAALRTLGYTGDEMTGHGFRHMASTVLHESGEFDSLVVERQLAHVDSNAIRGIYNAAEYLTERTRMMQWWADWLDERASNQ